MQKPKNEGIFYDSFDGVYLMRGSSPFHEFDHFDQKFFFNIHMNNKNLTLEFFFEYLYPHYADLMLGFTIKLKKNIEFYTVDKFLTDMMGDLYHYSFCGYSEVCTRDIKNMPAIEENSDFLTSIVARVKKEAPLLIENWNLLSPFMEGKAIELEASNTREILMQVTILILDEIFFSNQNCDRMHNRRKLEEITGMTFDEFLLMRVLCKRKSPGKLAFSPMHLIRLFQLMDCSAQMLTGQMYYKIKDNLDFVGLIEENAKKYLKEIEKFNKQCRSQLKKYMNAPLPSLVPFYDWNEALR